MILHGAGLAHTIESGHRETWRTDMNTTRNRLDLRWSGSQSLSRILSGCHVSPIAALSGFFVADGSLSIRFTPSKTPELSVRRKVNTEILSRPMRGGFPQGINSVIWTLRDVASVVGCGLVADKGRYRSNMIYIRGSRTAPLNDTFCLEKSE